MVALCSEASESGERLNEHKLILEPCHINVWRTREHHSTPPDVSPQNTIKTQEEHTQT